MIGLHRIGEALNVENRLIKLDGIRGIGVGNRRVAALSGRIGAEVATAVHPAIDLDMVVLQPLPVSVLAMAVMKGLSAELARVTPMLVRAPAGHSA